MPFATRALGAILTTAALAVVPASPAQAEHDYKCKIFYGNGDNIKVCIVETHDHYVHGELGYVVEDLSTQTFSGTVVVEQCSGLGTNCSTITATQMTLTSVDGYRKFGYTSTKPAAFGHVYRTCASGKSAFSSWTYVCTPFNAYGG